MPYTQDRIDRAAKVACKQAEIKATSPTRHYDDNTAKS